MLAQTVSIVNIVQVEEFVEYANNTYSSPHILFDKKLINTAPSAIQKNQLTSLSKILLRLKVE